MLVFQYWVLRVKYQSHQQNEFIWKSVSFPVSGAPCKITITSTKWDYLKESVSFPVSGAPCKITITSTKWDYLKESVSFPVPGAPCKIYNRINKINEIIRRGTWVRVKCQSHQQNGIIWRKELIFQYRVFHARRPKTLFTMFTINDIIWKKVLFF